MERRGVLAANHLSLLLPWRKDGALSIVGEGSRTYNDISGQN
jgi:hypothetical protein